MKKYTSWTGWMAGLFFTFILSLQAQEPFLKTQDIFPMEHWHNHSSCIVEAPNGDLLICWFNGSGERTADDVKIEGARKKKGAKNWGPRFTMADTPDYPDTNCTMFIDPQGRLWLIWPTILANQWETALLKYKIASKYDKDGPPQWEVSEVLHVTPGEEFPQTVNAYAEKMKGTPLGMIAAAYITRLQTNAQNKFTRRLGWMTRAHPIVLEGKRLIVPLYSDGFSFSLMAYTDDWGKSWKTSTPLVGAGNIQPAIAVRKDGSLYTLMRDNGPPPKRLHQSESFDRGQTWTAVTDSEHPNPGAGAEIINLKNGHWALISNDTERGRHSLCVAISPDEGKTWPWRRHLEVDAAGPEAGAFHYPTMIQARDGTLHASYSYHLNKKDVPNNPADGKPARKTIRHAHFNEAWVKQGNSGTTAKP